MQLSKNLARNKSVLVLQKKRSLHSGGIASSQRKASTPELIKQAVAVREPTLSPARLHNKDRVRNRCISGLRSPKDLCKDRCQQSEFR